MVMSSRPRTGEFGKPAGQRVHQADLPPLQQLHHGRCGCQYFSQGGHTEDGPFVQGGLFSGAGKGPRPTLIGYPAPVTHDDDSSCDQVAAHGLIQEQGDGVRSLGNLQFIRGGQGSGHEAQEEYEDYRCDAHCRDPSGENAVAA